MPVVLPPIRTSRSQKQGGKGSSENPQEKFRAGRTGGGTDPRSGSCASSQRLTQTTSETSHTTGTHQASQGPPNSRRLSWTQDRRVAHYPANSSHTGSSTTPASRANSNMDRHAGGRQQQQQPQQEFSFLSPETPFQDRAAAYLERIEEPSRNPSSDDLDDDESDNWRKRAAAEHMHHAATSPPLPSHVRHASAIPSSFTTGNGAPSLENPSINLPARSAFPRATSIPGSVPLQSPINPGSPSIYKHWPPDQPPRGMDQQNFIPGTAPLSACLSRTSGQTTTSKMLKSSSIGRQSGAVLGAAVASFEPTLPPPAVPFQSALPPVVDESLDRAKLNVLQPTRPSPLSKMSAPDGPNDLPQRSSSGRSITYPSSTSLSSGLAPSAGQAGRSISQPERNLSGPLTIGGGKGSKSPPSPSKRGHNNSAALWLTLLCALLLMWGLRESDRVTHLKNELQEAMNRQRNLTKLLKAHAPELSHVQPVTSDEGGASSGLDLKEGEWRATCSSSNDEQCSGASLGKDLILDDDEDNNEPAGTIHVHHLGLRRLAFFASLVCLIIPIVLFHYLDDLPSWLGMKYAEDSGGDVTLSKRLAYKVDVWFSSYSWVKSAALLVATMVLIGYGGLALYAVSGDEGLPLVDATWRAWTYVADAGNHADSSGLGPRIVSVLVSFGGMLIFALMVGLVTESISEKVDSLRKGKSDVIENNHTLVLGWSDKLGSLIKQLILANESAGGSVIVVMAEREKEDMENDIQKMELDMRGTSVICRSGSALVPADLKKVNVSAARAIVVLAEEDNADAADAHALRVVLSLCGIREGLKGHIVVELSDVDSDQLVKMVGGHIVETVVAHDVIGRLMIQCARQPGLAQIWETLLGFENCEFYSKSWPQLEGRTFREALVSFPDAVPIGLKVQGYMVLNPNDDYVLQAGDEVLVIAEDDDSYQPEPPAYIREVDLPEVFMPPKLPEKILFCGWRRDIDDMIVVLEAFLARGSELWIFSDVPIEEREERLMEGGLNPGELENMTLVHRLGNAVIRRHLESLPMETFDSILILADERHEDSIINCDSRSLATLLLIRDIQSKRIPTDDAISKNHSPLNPPTSSLPRMNAEKGHPHTNSSWVRQMQQASQKSIVISEILDSRTRSLVSVSQISDYVLSNELVSMALAMVAEDRAINQVLEELFAEEGNEMYIRPAELYIHPEERASFFELMARARKRMEIMIGYKRGDAETAVINPPNKCEVLPWSFADSFVVLSFEE